MPATPPPRVWSRTGQGGCDTGSGCSSPTWEQSGRRHPPHLSSQSTSTLVDRPTESRKVHQSAARAPVSRAGTQGLWASLVWRGALMLCQPPREPWALRLLWILGSREVWAMGAC